MYMSARNLKVGETELYWVPFVYPKGVSDSNISVIRRQYLVLQETDK